MLTCDIEIRESPEKSRVQWNVLNSLELVEVNLAKGAIGIS